MVTHYAYPLSNDRIEYYLFDVKIGLTARVITSHYGLVLGKNSMLLPFLVIFWYKA